MTVEAKSGEALDRLIKEWLPAPDDLTPSGKPKRLQFLRDYLGLQAIEVGELRYQLLHRAASAIVMGQRFGATAAIMLIHSFGGSADEKTRDDCHVFCKAMDAVPSGNALVATSRPSRLPLFIGWVADKPAADATIADAM